MQSSLLGFLLIKLPEQSDWSLTFPSGDPLVDLTQNDYSLWPFCWVSSYCIPTTSCGPCLSNYGSTQAPCSSYPKLRVHYQTLLSWPRLRRQHLFPDQRHAMHPFQHLLHLLMAMQARLVCSDQSDTKTYVLGGKHWALPLHTTTAGCSTGCGKPCSASLWLPSALVSEVLHYILHSNPDSEEERSMAVHPVWWAGDWQALYFIFPTSQTNALEI